MDEGNVAWHVLRRNLKPASTSIVRDIGELFRSRVQLCPPQEHENFEAASDLIILYQIIHTMHICRTSISRRPLAS